VLSIISRHSLLFFGCHLGYIIQRILLHCSFWLPIQDIFKNSSSRMHQWGTPFGGSTCFLYRQRMLIAFAECASCLYFETPIIVASEGSSRLIITLSSFPFLSFSDILLCNCAFYTQRSVDSFAESASCLYFETPIIIVASEGSSRLTTLSSFPSLSFYDILLLATGGNSKT
jgi:hypothetical protein